MVHGDAIKPDQEVLNSCKSSTLKINCYSKSVGKSGSLALAKRIIDAGMDFRDDLLREAQHCQFFLSENHR